MSVVHLTVKARLLLSFGALAALAILVSGVALAALGKGHDDFVGYLNQGGARVTLANDVLDAASARAIGARNLVLVTERERDEAVTHEHRMPPPCWRLIKTAGDYAIHLESPPATRIFRNAPSSRQRICSRRRRRWRN